MNQDKVISLMIECEECKNRFKISSNESDGQVNHKKEYKIDGQSIFLTYYDCPHCGKRHFVQIDDISSLQELTKVTREFYRLAAMKKRDKIISKKQSDKFMKSRQHLSDYRINLMKKFTGKTITDETGTSYILRFSV